MTRPVDRFSLVLIVVGIATLILLVLALIGCGPKPQPGPVGPQPDASAVCPGYTAEGYRCVACGQMGVYAQVDKQRMIYCVAKGLGCFDSKCQSLPVHP